MKMNHNAAGKSFFLAAITATLLSMASTASSEEYLRHNDLDDITGIEWKYHSAVESPASHIRDHICTVRFQRTAKRSVRVSGRAGAGSSAGGFYTSFEFKKNNRAIRRDEITKKIEWAEWTHDRIRLHGQAQEFNEFVTGRLNYCDRVAITRGSGGEIMTLSFRGHRLGLNLIRGTVRARPPSGATTTWVTSFTPAPGLLADLAERAPLPVRPAAEPEREPESGGSTPGYGFDRLTEGGERISATTLARDPDLAATVVHDEVHTFVVRNSRGDVVLKARLQARVARNHRGELIFSPRIHDVSASTGYSVRILDLRGFQDIDAKVAYRSDGLGEVAPQVAHQSRAGLRMTYPHPTRSSPLGNGNSSRFLSIRGTTPVRDWDTSGWAVRGARYTTTLRNLPAPVR